jgi:hypothetical protein
MATNHFVRDDQSIGILQAVKDGRFIAIARRPGWFTRPARDIELAQFCWYLSTGKIAIAKCKRRPLKSQFKKAYMVLAGPHRPPAAHCLACNLNCFSPPSRLRILGGQIDARPEIVP